jgi:hypothetical protein
MGGSNHTQIVRAILGRSSNNTPSTSTTSSGGGY